MTRMQQLTLRGQTLVLRPAAIEEILDLRHRVLRPGRPAQEARFDGDSDPAARHFGAFTTDTPSEARCLACLSFLPEDYASRPAMRLRGMATDEPWQGQGLGRALLSLGCSQMRDLGASLLWCHARTEAVDFYRRMGWRTDSEIFLIPGVGPHRRMVHPLAPDGL